jgi:phosphoglycolate phosphatase
MTLGKRLPIRGVLFDWDGTLIDSYHADSSAYLGLFEQLEVPWGLAELNAHYSPDWYAVYRAAGIAKHRWDEADGIWRANYAKHKPKLISGARRVLGQLARRYKLGLVTSGDRDRVSRQLREYQFANHFRTRICGGDLKEKKPHPAPLLAALKKMRLQAGESVYVGDTPQDMEMSRAAGVLAIGVLGPFPTEKQLRAAKPEFVLESLEELPKLLKKISG